MGVQGLFSKNKGNVLGIQLKMPIILAGLDYLMMAFTVVTCGQLPLFHCLDSLLL